jgi:CheY-like chemotaxis protein
MEPTPFLIGVVDDDPRVLESLEELLASGGYQVLACPSAETFLAANGFEQVDCLISDIGMPGMTGWELLRLARTGYPDVPVILVTARDEVQAREAVDVKGARLLLKKPFDGKQLMTALETILRPGPDRPRIA